MVRYAVIGANYGDEGKGLVANKLCREAKLHSKSVINVLTNGGCQRGHTAYDKNGNRHVYSHFGAGFSYADIYFSKFFMVNPMLFMNEYLELKNITDQMNRIYIDEDCTITTPFDMLINRMIERRRENRHGSCGYGIWETVRRNEAGHPIYWKDIVSLGTTDIIDKLKTLRDNYFKNIVVEYGITLTDEEREMYYSDNLIENYAADTVNMTMIANVRSYKSIECEYDVVVFENAQGLLLDRYADEWGTPTRTGMAYIKELTSGEVIPYYVTRSYITKHGNGLFPGETSVDKINKYIVDKTNCPNDYQGTLRYGLFNKELADQLLDRIKADAEGYDYKIVVTHQNEYQSEYLTFADYYSYNETDF